MGALVHCTANPYRQVYLDRNHRQHPSHQCNIQSQVSDLQTCGTENKFFFIIPNQETQVSCYVNFQEPVKYLLKFTIQKFMYHVVAKGDLIFFESV